ncbi:helix-turn-helix transcriptional regulator [Paenibacillus sp. FSL M7-0802]|uniref:helix-turn-helix domain-containing protein n=1 Tax=Paenibacillus sp. FSL M7-0802 TaxID=2921536 RepID=UPI0030F807DB
MDSLGERVRLLRIQSKLNMEELAAELKLPVYDKETGEIIEYKSISKASISNLEKGKHRPNVDMAIAIAKFFGVSLDWLLLGEGEQESKYMELINEPFKTEKSLYIFENLVAKTMKKLLEEHYSGNKYYNMIKKTSKKEDSK